MDQRRVINKFVKKVAKAVRPEAILLFGSRARGSSRADSDFDFIVVAETFGALDQASRFSLVSRQWEYGQGVGVDILTFTPSEFRKAIPRSFILRDALKDAKVLYGSIPLHTPDQRSAA